MKTILDAIIAFFLATGVGFTISFLFATLGCASNSQEGTHQRLSNGCEQISAPHFVFTACPDSYLPDGNSMNLNSNAHRHVRQERDGCIYVQNFNQYGHIILDLSYCNPNSWTLYTDQGHWVKKSESDGVRK